MKQCIPLMRMRRTFRALVSRMPDDCLDKHLFLSPIQHPKNNVWFENIVNLGESTLWHVIRTMAPSAGLVGDFTNKSGRVTTITRMRIANVSEYVIAANSGHKNIASSERYYRVKALKVRAAQALARAHLMTR